MISFIRV